MSVTEAIAQIRTTDLEGAIDFYVRQLGFELEFRHQDFYAGIRAGNSRIHLKLVDDRDPSIDFVRQGGHLHLYFPVYNAREFARRLKGRGVTFLTEPRSTEYSTDEFSVVDNDGHILYFAEVVR